jgi:hypothetical protein
MLDTVFEICDVRLAERDDAQAYSGYLTDAHTRGLTIIEPPPLMRPASIAIWPPHITRSYEPTEIPLCLAPYRFGRDGCQSAGYYSSQQQ